MTYYKQKYRTRQGERWPDLALAFYDNATKTAPLVEANLQYANLLIFPEGLLLRIPKLPSQPPSSLPPWKRGGA